MDFARRNLFPLYNVVVAVVVVSPCKFVGIRGLDKTTAPLFLPLFFFSVEGLAARECRIVGNSVQLGHSQLGTLTPRAHVIPFRTPFSNFPDLLREETYDRSPSPSLHESIGETWLRVHLPLDTSALFIFAEISDLIAGIIS